jgi:hypothetical protein
MRLKVYAHLVPSRLNPSIVQFLQPFSPSAPFQSSQPASQLNLDATPFCLRTANLTEPPSLFSANVSSGLLVPPVHHASHWHSGGGSKQACFTLNSLMDWTQAPRPLETEVLRCTIAAAALNDIPG